MEYEMAETTKLEGIMGRQRKDPIVLGVRENPNRRQRTF